MRTRTQAALHYSAIFGAVGGFGAHAQLATAQEVSSDPIAEVVVTATKRGSAAIKDVPIAIQALSADSLQAKGAMDFADFYHSISGLSVQDEGPGDKRYVIRGVNSVGAGTVGLYLDENIVTGENSQNGGGQAPDIKLFDIDRVEVLKGPQGTTFGSSSMSGTIRYITRKADVDDLTVDFQTALRSTDGASLGLQTDGALNVPIVPGVFAVRVAGFYADLPGFISNRFHSGANSEESKAGRISTTLKISDDLTLTGMAMLQDVNQDSKNYFYRTDYAGNAISRDGYQQPDVAQAPYVDESNLYNATLEYRAQGLGTFTATGSRFDRDTTFNRDASLAAQAFFGLAFDGAGRSILSQPKNRRFDSFEARFASSWDSRFQVLAGVFASEEHRFFRSFWPTVNAQGVADASSRNLLDRTVDTRIKEQALFGELSFAATDALKFTIGGRLFDFDLKERATAVTAAGGAPGAGAGPLTHAEDDGLIGRFNIAYELSDQVSSYIQAAQGFRSGGTNDQTAAALANVVIPAGYGSDALWNYEVGVKTSLFDRRLSFNTALYYIDWSDIQVRAQATDGQLSFPYTGNGGKASVKGVEAELEARPLDGLRFSATATYTQAELTRDNPIASTGRKGDPVPYVPEWSFSGAAEYSAPIATFDMDGVIGGDFSYTGSSATYFNATIANYHELDAYFLAGLHAGVRGDDWSAMLNVTNLFNDDTIINYNEIVPGVYPDGYYISRPRTISLGFSKSFSF